MKNLRKVLQWIMILMVGGIVLLLCIPYFIPLNSTQSYNDPSKLFPNSQFKKVQGIDVHYRIFPCDTPTKGNVLMVHGFAGSTFSWRKNIVPLTQKGFQVVCIDLPNFGYSERKFNGDFSIENRANLIWEILETILPNQKWHLIGHSMGASIILAMGQIQPEKAISLICVDGLFFSSHPSFLTKFFLNSGYVQRIGEIALQKYFTKPHRFKKILESAYGKPPDEEAIQGYLQPLTVRDTGKGIFAMTANQNSNFIVDYGKIHPKMFLIWGEKDTWIPIQTAIQFHQKYPYVPFKKIIDAGHCPMETHSDEFNKILWEYLQSLEK